MRKLEQLGTIALINPRGQVYSLDNSKVAHAARIKNELRNLGVTPLSLLRAESRYLPNIVHQDEYIGGVVYGKYQGGYAMLCATDSRVIFLDKQLLFINEDEVSYYVVSGVSHNRAGLGSTVTLHARIKDFSVRTFNTRCAERFIRYIESRCLEHKSPKEENDDYYTQNWSV